MFSREKDKFGSGIGAGGLQHGQCIHSFIHQIIEMFHAGSRKLREELTYAVIPSIDA